MRTPFVPLLIWCIFAALNCSESNNTSERRPHNVANSEVAVFAINGPESPFRMPEFRTEEFNRWNDFSKTRVEIDKSFTDRTSGHGYEPTGSASAYGVCERR